MTVVIPIVAGIGNALLAVPMVRQLKRGRPESRIVVLARIDAMAEVFRRLSEVDEVIVTPRARDMIRESRSRKPDLYLVPFPSNRWQYSMLAATSGATKTLLHSYPVGYWRAMHFVGTRVPARRGVHDVEQNLELLKAPGVEVDPTEVPTFAVRDEDRTAAERLLGGTEEFIVVHAGSAKTVLAQAKRWPTAKYRELIAAMKREHDFRVIVVEGPDEEGVGREISEREEVVALRGSLGEAAAVLERARLYVGSDSGLAHLAAAVGTAPVTIFAAADPSRVCPFGYRDLVVQTPTACSPCFAYPWKCTYPKLECRVPYCVEQVTVEMVLASVKRGLSRSKNEVQIGRSA